MSVKYFLLFAVVFCFQGISAQDTFSGPGVYSSGEINEYTDRLLRLLRPALIENGLDPFKLDDMSQDFWFKFLLVNYTGHIDLKNGWVQDLSSIYRLGDTKLKYDKKILTLDIKLVVDNLRADFDYTAKIFELGPSGRLICKITKQEIRFGILVDFERVTFRLQQFSLSRNDNINIKMTGLGLADPIVNVIIGALTAVFKNAILESINDQIRVVLEEILEMIPPLLPPLPSTNSPSLLDILLPRNNGYIEKNALNFYRL